MQSEIRLEGLARTPWTDPDTGLPTQHILEFLNSLLATLSARLPESALEIITGGFTNNDPSSGYVSWQDIRLTFQGKRYSIAPDNSNDEWIYWRLANKNEFLSSASKPTPTATQVIIGRNVSGTLQELWRSNDIASNAIQGIIDAATAQTDATQALADAAQAISDAAGAQATADGKVTTFFQTSPPTAEGVGDLWIDTDDGDKLYRWNGSSWADVQDADIAQAISDAADAQSTADGKIVTFYQASQPTGSAVGDLWVDTDDDNKLYRWNGSTWQSARDAGIAQALADAAQAISDAAGAQATADGKVVTFVQGTQPTAEGVGDLWIDSSDKNKLYRWSGSSWIEVRDTDIAQAITDASNAQATADGKVVTFVQTSPPTAEGVGDLWIDSDDNNHPYRWSGSAWVSMRDGTIATAQNTADSKNTIYRQATQPGSADAGDLWVETDDNNRVRIYNGSTWDDCEGDLRTRVTNGLEATTGIVATGKVDDDSIDDDTIILRHMTEAAVGVALGYKSIPDYSGTISSTPTDIDLSSEIPAGYNKASVHVEWGTTGTAGVRLQVYEKGQGGENRIEGYSVTSGQLHHHGVLGVDSNRKLSGENGTSCDTKVTVCTYFL